jgi:4-amino-4-deoxy-L-arabinose transferase-like glycosyltransferase
MGQRNAAADRVTLDGVRSPRLTLAALLAITLLALGLRLGRLTFQPLWWDEGTSVYFASQPLSDLTAATAADIHPPFYYVLLHFWMLLCGRGEAALRLFSVVIGALTIPLIYLVGRRLFDTRTAFLAALLLALSPFHVYYSQEVRMYAPVTLLGLASVYLMLRLLEEPNPPHLPGEGRGVSPPRVGEEPGERSAWLGYVLATSLAMYTHYYAAFLPLFQTLFVLLHWRRSRAILGRWLLAQVALLVLYVPWVVYAGDILVRYVLGKVAIEHYAPLGPLEFLWQAMVALGLGHSATLSWLQPASLIFLVLAVLGAVAGSPEPNIPLPRRDGGGPGRERVGVAGGRSFVLLYLLVPIVGAYLIDLAFPFSPQGFQRLFLCALPAYLLLVARGISDFGLRISDFALRKQISLSPIRNSQFAIRNPKWAIALAVCALLFVLALADFYTVPRYPRRDYRPLMAQLSALARPEDVVLCLYPWQAGYLQSYGRQPLPSLRYASIEEVQRWASEPPTLTRSLDDLLARYPRLWFPAYQEAGRDLEERMVAYLSQQAYPVSGDWFGDSRLFFYAAGSPTAEMPPQANFDDRLLLLGAAMGEGPVEAGRGVLPIALRWQRLRPLEGDYRVALRLADDAGYTWAQQDSAPVAGLRPFATWADGEVVSDRHGLLIPAGTPPGNYSLKLSVYNSTTGQSLSLRDTAGRLQGTELTLATIPVQKATYAPPIEALFIPYPLRADFTAPDQTIRLLGYVTGEAPLRPGEKLPVTLFWQALGTGERDYVLTIQLQDSQGKLWGLAETPGDYPTSRWSAGELVKGQYAVRLPPDAPDGGYKLLVGLLDPATKARLAVWRGDAVALRTVQAVGRKHVYAAPAPSHPVAARLGDVAELLGYDLAPAEARPGGALRLVLYWRAPKNTDISFTVFVHLVDTQGRSAGQQDTLPAGGEAPTITWLPGEIIVDVHELTVRPEAAPGEYTLHIGLYDAATGARLPVYDAAGQPLGDSLRLATVQVR